MRKNFLKTTALNGPSYKKIPFSPSTSLNFEDKDRICFLWLILSEINTRQTRHTDRISNYRQYVGGLNIHGFDFTNGLKFTDVYVYEKLNNLSLHIFALSFHQIDKEWKHK